MSTVIRACKACGWTWRQDPAEEPKCPKCSRMSAGDSQVRHLYV